RRAVTGGACASPPRWLGDSPSGPGDAPLRAGTSAARTRNLHLPDHLLSALRNTIAARSRRTAGNRGGPDERLGDVDLAGAVPDAHGERAHREVGRQAQRLAGLQVELRAVTRARDRARVLVPHAEAHRAVVVGAAILDRVELPPAVEDADAEPFGLDELRLAG